MLDIDINILIFVGLIFISICAIAYFFLFVRVSQEIKISNRLQSVKKKKTQKKHSNIAVQNINKRRKEIQGSLKELDRQQKRKNKSSLSLKSQLRRIGVELSIFQFYVFSIIFGLMLGLIAFLLNLPLFFVPVSVVVGTIGIPRWLLGFLIKRRTKRFLEEFPNAIEIIVRGIKSGLPFVECLNIISTESSEPVKSEFLKIVEAQQMGLSVSEAITRLYESMPLPEVNFFVIAISIQQKSGGSLSEVLGNLSKVLRDRKKMKAKISALSAEAKASALIIGLLPIVVAFLVYITTPDYMLTLFIHPTGQLILLGSGIWMGIGIIIMKNMVNFDI